MIVGTGVDIVDIARFERQLERTPRLRERLFVPHERELAPRSLAARFAVKEAAAKALLAPPGMIWQDCWVTNDPHGAPRLHTTGTVEREQRARCADLAREHLPRRRHGRGVRGGRGTGRIPR